MKKLAIILLAGLISTPAIASDIQSLKAGDFIARLRIVSVDPDADSKVTGLATDVKADNAIVPELDFTYFFTKNIAAELILATSKHDISATAGIDLGDVWVLPPTINAQYHFRPDSRFRPYAGLGVGYIFYYDENPGDVNSIKYDDGFSYSLQAGADYMIDNNWGINLDFKKIYHNTKVSINNGAITADVDLDPWVWGVGVTYKF